MKTVHYKRKRCWACRKPRRALRHWRRAAAAARCSRGGRRTLPQLAEVSSVEAARAQHPGLSTCPGRREQPPCRCCVLRPGGSAPQRSVQWHCSINEGQALLLLLVAASTAPLAYHQDTQHSGISFDGGNPERKRMLVLSWYSGSKAVQECCVNRYCWQKHAAKSSACRTEALPSAKRQWSDSSV